MRVLFPVPPCTQKVIFEYPDVLNPVPLRSESADQPALAMTLMDAVPRLIAVSLKVTVLLQELFRTFLARLEMQSYARGG